MERGADSSERGGRGSIGPLGGWGPTVLIVAGTLLTLLGVFFWGWVVQNTGPKSSSRPVSAWLIMSGILVALAGVPAWWVVLRFVAPLATKTKFFAAGFVFTLREEKGLCVDWVSGRTPGVVGVIVQGRMR